MKNIAFMVLRSLRCAFFRVQTFISQRLYKDGPDLRWNWLRSA